MQKCKRILAALLCLVLLAVYMPIIPAQTALAATVTTAENAEIISYFNGSSQVLLYEDDFSNKADYVKAYGSSSKYLYWEQGKLSYPNTATGDSKVGNSVSFYGLTTNSNAMQNYTVSADVTSMADGYMCARAYGVYEFGIYQNKFRLYRRNTKAATLGGSQPTVSSFFGADSGYVPGSADGTPGSIVTVSITATTTKDNVTHLLCTATFGGVTKTIFDIDDTDNNTTAGAPGLASNTGGVGGKPAGYFHGVKVMAELSDSVELYSLNGTKKQLLYADTFADNTAYLQAVANGSKLAVSDGHLINNGTGNSAKFYGIENYTAMQNYTVEADVVSKMDAGITNTAIGVVGYGAYEFCVYGDRLRLYRRTTTAAELISGNTNGKAITGYFSDYVPGDVLTLSLHLSTVINADTTQTVYVVGCITHKGITKQICSVADESGECTAGYAGLMLNQQDTAAYIDGARIYMDAAETDASVLYSDGYTVAHGYGVAKGDLASTNPYPTLYQNGNLLFNKMNGQQYIVFNGIANSATLQNYTVSADVVMTEEAAGMAGIAGYSTTGGKGYEYVVYQNKLRLYNRVTAEHLISATAITSFVPTYVLGDTLRLVMTLVTNEDNSVTILCSVSHKGKNYYVGSYTDNNEKSNTAGAPGLRGAAANATAPVDAYVDNILVQTYSGDIQKEIYNIVGFDIDTILNIGSDETCRNVSWQTAFDLDCVVEYAPKANLVEGEFPTAEGSFASVASVHEKGVKTGNYVHNVTMTNLQPDVEYVYRIRSGDVVSELYSFSNDSVDDGYSFSFMGDPQVGRVDGDIAEWEKTMDALTQNFDVDFMMSLGDEVHTPTANYYGGFVTEELAGLATSTIIGNHDTASIYGEYFNLPNESNYGVTTPGSDYWFVYGNTLFMVLNSNSLSTAEHIAFMEEAIAANPDVVWKVVSMHHCIYSVSIHGEDENVLTLRQELVPAFNQLDVDVVLMGHDHCYTRTYMMNGFEPDTSKGVQNSVTNSEGILYITANSSSGSKYNGVRFNSAPFAAVFEQSSRRTFAVVEVTDEKFDIVTYYADDLTVMDSIALNKTPQCEDDAHVYDHDCDTKCNVCGKLRETQHVYTNDCDTDCNVCFAERAIEHTYENDCDADCNVCGESREIKHIYTNDCDVDCNVCGEEREVGEHVYDGICDADCNVCGAVRDVPDHTYDDDVDLDCNECGNLRYLRGDLNGDNEVSDADAVYLLMHTFFADVYPVNQPCDFNNDSEVSDADAVYLLMHTFFPSTYPIT